MGNDSRGLGFFLSELEQSYKGDVERSAQLTKLKKRVGWFLVPCLAGFATLFLATEDTSELEFVSFFVVLSLCWWYLVLRSGLSRVTRSREDTAIIYSNLPAVDGGKLSEMQDDQRQRLEFARAKFYFNSKIDEVNKQTLSTRRQFMVSLVLIVTLVAFSAFFLVNISEQDQSKIGSSGLAGFLVSLEPEAVLSLLVYAAGALIWSLHLWIRLRGLERDRKDLDLYERPNDIQETDKEKAARRLLWSGEVQLRRYYDLNLRQNRLIAALGTACVLAGLVLVWYTLDKVASTTTSKTEGLMNGQGFVALIGIVGTIAVNFVGALFLKMHQSASRSMTAFHGRLIGSHDLYLANSVAVGIKDDIMRWKTLQKIALEMTRRSTDENDSGETEG